jgi:hypothetical protein
MDRPEIHVTRAANLGAGWNKKGEARCHLSVSPRSQAGSSRAAVVRQTLRVAQAMNAGATNRLWTIEDIAGLIG